MKFATTSLVCCITLVFSGLTQAEIYQTKDAEGNTVFSDVPTAGAEEVDLPAANVADQVKESTHPSPETSAAPSAAPKSQEQGNVTIIDYNDNELLEEGILRHRRHEVLEGEKPHEVGDPGPRATPHVGGHRR